MVQNVGPKRPGKFTGNSASFSFFSYLLLWVFGPVFDDYNQYDIVFPVYFICKIMIPGRRTDMGNIERMSVRFSRSFGRPNTVWSLEYTFTIVFGVVSAYKIYHMVSSWYTEN